METKIHPFSGAFLKPGVEAGEGSPSFIPSFTDRPVYVPPPRSQGFFSRDKKRRRQFKKKLAVSLFSHQPEKGRNSWSMHVNTCTYHPPPTPWWNWEASARWNRSSLSVVCLCTARGCELILPHAPAVPCYLHETFTLKSKGWRLNK